MSDALAARLASRYLDATSALSIARTGNLERFLLCSSVLCIVTVVGFLTAATLTRTAPRVVHDVDVAFELQCAPPEPSFRTADTLIPLRFEEGSKPAAFATAAKKDVKKDGVVTAQTQPQQGVEESKKLASHAVPEAAPIAVNRVVIPSEPKSRPMTAMLPNPFAGSAANAAVPAAASPAGGEADGVAGATAAGGNGLGVGQGDTNALQGGDFGIANGISTRAPAVALGNIGPYKRDLVARLKAAWHPDGGYESVTVDIALGHDGKVLEKKILVSSGDEHVDESLMKALDSVELAALPDWYRGHELHIKLVLKNT